MADTLSVASGQILFASFLLTRHKTSMTQVIIVAIVITALVLGVGGAMTNIGPWYRNLKKPAWNPPDWIFGPAWTTILGLAAYAGVLAWTNAPAVDALLRIGVACGSIAIYPQTK